MVLQWHITNRCNLRCVHCYQREYLGEELKYEWWDKIIKQFHELCKLGPRINDRINVTGGEPFLHKNLPRLLMRLRREGVRVGIMTNGTLISEHRVKLLKETEVDWVQVSIDGGKTTHDSIRGDGSFEKAIEGIRALVSAGIRVQLSFTATKHTYEDFFLVADLGHELGVDRVWTDRVIQAPDLELNAEETYHFMTIINKTRTHFLHSNTMVVANRALQFLINGGRPYSCGVGRSIITVMPNGDVMGCRRLGEVVGNVKDSSLVNYHSFLGSYQCIPKECGGCKFKEYCRGGLKCQGIPDPGCWLKEKHNG